MRRWLVLLAFAWLVLPASASAQLLTGSLAGGGGGGGGATSVGLAAPAGFSVSGSPVTSSGTLTFTFTSTPTGTGLFVLQNTPTLITPILGVASGTSLTLSSLAGTGTRCVNATAGGLLGVETGACGSGSGLPTGLTFSTPTFTVATGAANQSVIAGSTTGNPVTYSATGSDTDIGITLTPKGAGHVFLNGPADVGQSYAGASTTGTFGPQALFVFQDIVSGNHDNVYGIWSSLDISGSNRTVGNYYGYWQQNPSFQSGTNDVITNFSGIRLEGWQASGTGNSVGTQRFIHLVDSVSGAITNNIGIDIGNITRGGTLNRAIRTGLGIVEFGDAVTIAGNLTVAGTITTTGTAGPILITNIATPGSTPASGTTDLYVKTSTKQLCTKDDTGTEVCGLGGSGSTAFSALTTSTNTTATMTVGTGGTLTFSGSGVVNASTLGGATFAAPGAIGGTTPAAGTFTTIVGNTSVSSPQFTATGAASGQLTLNGSTSGSAIITVAAVAGTPANLVLPTSTGTNGQVLTTNGGTPQQLSWTTVSGGSTAFSALTGSTNTTAAMVVGTGASLGVSGSGTIAATTTVALATARTINGTSFDGTGNITVTAAAGTLTGTTLNATVVTSSLASVGTIGTGVWQGTAVAAGFGGTGQTTYTKGDLLVTPGSTTINKLAVGTDGQVLTADAASTNGVKWAAGGGGSGCTVPGSNTQVIFNDSGACGADAGLTYNKTTDVLTAVGGYVSGGSGAGTLSLTQGTAPSLGTTAVSIYAPTSVTSYAFVLPTAAGDGVLLNSNSSNVVTQSFVGTTGTSSFVRATSPTLVTPTIGAAQATSVQFTDATLINGGTNILSQRNGTNAQQFEVYNTFTSSTNNERLYFQWSGNTASIKTERGSAGGTVRSLTIQTGGDVANGGSITLAGTGSGVRLGRNSSNLAVGASSEGDVTGWNILNTGVHLTVSADNTYNIGSTTSAVKSVFARALDTASGGGAATLTVGTSNATAVTVGASGITTTLNSATISAPNMTQSSAAQTGTVCWASGGLTVDTTVGCLTSTMRVKERWTPLRARDLLAMVNRIEPGSFFYRAGFNMGREGEQVGLAAEQVASVDTRLVGLDAEGQPLGVKYREYTAVLTGAIQALTQENAALRVRVEALESR